MRRTALLLALVVVGCGGDDKPRAPQGAPVSDAAAPTPSAPRLAVQRIATLSQPLLVTQPPDDPRRLFVVQKGGSVRVIRDGRLLHRPFLSIRRRVTRGVEQGLVGLAFAPSYARSRRFYIAFTDRKGNLRIEEWRASRRSPDRADRSTRRLVLRIYKPRETHNGGHLLFGPDGLLYVGVGDGGGPGDPRRKSQNRASLLGKLLRIDPRAHGRRRYRSPVTNPFVRRRGARDEIYAYGLRNPWRFWFDRKTRAFVLGDVGQEAYEELDYRPWGRLAGANFGWSAWEGNHRFNRRLKARNHVRPMHTYGRDNGCSVIAGPVVRDPALLAWEGRMLYGDFCTGDVRSITPRAPRGRLPRRERLTVPALSSFGEDSAGRVYVTSLAGPVYRLTRSGS